jgi:hypothetical protein
MFSPRSGAFALAFLTALLTLPSRAFGFCRTITAQIPADFDQTAECYAPAGAIPLWWSNSCVGFSVQKDGSKAISLADATTHATAAFGKWMAASCPGGGNPSVTVSNEGPVACDLVGYSEVGPNQHAIIFRDTSWPHSDPYNTLALTTVTFDVDSGEIYDADMEVNTAQTQIVVNTAPGPNQYDFDTIITHEAGHFLGLAHTPIELAMMFARYNVGTLGLTTDDIAGICAIYAPGGARAHDFDSGTHIEAVSSQAASCDPTPRHGFGSACGPFGTPPATTTKRGCTVSPTPGGGSAGGGGMLAVSAAILGLGIARRRRAARLPGMRRLRTFAFGTAVLLGLGAGAASLLVSEPVAHASVSIAVLFDELVRDSSAAAVVTPYEQKAVWEDGRIITYTHVHADRTVAGTLESDPWIRTMGGTVGRVGQLVDGEPVLTVGRPGLLFLQGVPQVGGVYAVTARAQGQFPVVLGEKNVSILRASSAVGGLMPPPDSRTTQMAQLRAKAGLAAEAPRASEVLHLRPVEDALRDVAAAWTRIHGSK